MNYPTIEYLRENLRCEAGILFWIRPARARQLARPAGHLCSRGYREIGIAGHNYRAHLIIWALHHGAWPQSDLDHINGQRDDNRIENLRPATRSQNLANSKGRSSNLKGAHFDKRRGKWKARITVNYVELWLGSFDTEVEAHEAYMAAAKEHFGEFARAA